MNTTVNPFIAAMAARGHKAAGDEWARLALACKDRALAEWAEWERCIDLAASGFVELACQADADRSDPEWSRIEAEIADKLEAEREVA